jgi:hypothetical protein
MGTDFCFGKKCGSGKRRIALAFDKNPNSGDAGQPMCGCSMNRKRRKVGCFRHPKCRSFDVKVGWIPPINSAKVFDRTIVENYRLFARSGRSCFPGTEAGARLNLTDSRLASEPSAFLPPTKPYPAPLSYISQRTDEAQHKVMSR